MQTVELFATHAAIYNVLGTGPGRVPGATAATFPINPEACKTRLGHWLATQIFTTRREDDASLLFLTLRETLAEVGLKKLLQQLANQPVHGPHHLDAAYDQMTAWYEQQRKLDRMYGEDAYLPHHVEFQWPALGSRECSQIEDVAAYFDFCGKRVRALRPVRVRAGMSQTEVPAELLQL